MKEWRTFSRFPCSASSYYALMLDGDFQARAHVRGLGMACYDVVDEPNDDGARLNRVVYSEPRLNLPAVLERVMKRAQAYHERAVFDLRDRSRFVRVVPCVGLESINFTFHERVRPDEVLGGALRGGVGRAHVGGHRLDAGQPRLIAVGAAGGGEDDAADSGGPRGFEALHVRHQDRIGDAGPPVDSGKHHFGIRHLGHPLRRDEAAGFDDRKSSRAQPVD